MKLFYNLDGKILAAGMPAVGPDSRGLRYGDGVFETMKLTDGRLQLADAHFARLWKGMQLLSFEPGKHFTPELLENDILQLARRNNHIKAARIRLQIFRGNGGLFDPDNHQPHYIIQSWALHDAAPQLNSNGLVTGIYRKAFKACDSIANLKHNNYLPYALAAIEAKKQQWNDAFLLNQFGRLCDSSIANLFLLKNRQLFTPALGEGCVAGIMREQLIRILKNTEWAVQETQVSETQLLEADELFVTNSIHPIRWVKQCAQKEYTCAAIGEIFSLLLPTIQ